MALIGCSLVRDPDELTGGSPEGTGGSANTGGVSSDGGSPSVTGGQGGASGGTDAGGAGGTGGAGTGGSGPYSRSGIVCDGVKSPDEWSDAENKFATTTTGYDMYVAWDAETIYLMLTGADVSTSDNWFFMYFDTTANRSGNEYGRQQGSVNARQLPFLAQRAIQLQLNGSATLRDATDSYAIAAGMSSSDWEMGTDVVEFCLPRVLFGEYQELGFVAYALDETSGHYYAGVPDDTLVDGTSNEKLASRFVFDLASDALPADATSLGTEP